MTFFDVSRAIRTPDIVGGYAQGMNTGRKQGQAARLQELARSHGAGLSKMDPAALDAFAREDPAMVSDLRYRQGRDATTDARDQRNFDYRAGRDVVSDQRYGDKLAYEQGRDAIADQRYVEEQAYTQGRAAAADARTQRAADYAQEQQLARGVFAELDSATDPAAIYPTIRAAAVARDPDLAQYMPEEYNPEFAAGMRGFYGIPMPERPKPLSAEGKRAYDRDVLGLDAQTDTTGMVVLADGTRTAINAANMTAGQANGVRFANRMITANKTLDLIGDQGYDPTNVKDILLDKTALTQWLRSESGKRWKAAAGEWIVAMIRPDTGAAVTEQEWDLYGPIYFPQLGDGPEVLAEKTARRDTATRSQLLTLGVDSYDQGQTPATGAPATGAPAVGAVQGGYRYVGGDPAKPSSWVETR